MDVCHSPVLRLAQKQMHTRTGISSLYNISIYFIGDTVFRNTINIEFDTSTSKKNIYREEDTDLTAAEKVHNTLCSKHVTSFI